MTQNNLFYVGSESLSWEKTAELLESATPITHEPAITPQRSYAYFFRGMSKRSKNDFNCDQYRFIYQGQYHNREKGILKRYYKIKNPEGKLKETLDDFNGMFTAQQKQRSNHQFVLFIIWEIHLSFKTLLMAIQRTKLEFISLP